MTVPAAPKIYHITHVENLPSIISDGGLSSEAEVARRACATTTIGMKTIKWQRLNTRVLASHPGLHVGGCVPFYFCPRSIMLYVIHQANHPNLTYRGGQEPIVHLEADLRATVAWAEANSRRWAFTLSNAGSSYFEDRCDLAKLDEIDWEAVRARDWQQCKDGKQAEFLIERSFPWNLVTCVGVYAQPVLDQVNASVRAPSHYARVEIRREWYY